jgi:hypothetical protein
MVLRNVIRKAMGLKLGDDTKEMMKVLNERGITFCHSTTWAGASWAATAETPWLDKVAIARHLAAGSR